MDSDWLWRETVEAGEIISTLALVFMAVVVPGLVQMEYGISAVKLMILVVLAYLTVHLMIVHIKQVTHFRTQDY